jgi:predicted PurR-regulated permease PerM
MALMPRRDGIREKPDPVELDPDALTGLFGPPKWLRDLGESAWLAVGVTGFVIAVVWLLALTHTIVAPVITAAIVAAVASPLVRKLSAGRFPRGLASAGVLLFFVVVVGGVILLILAGITSQLAGIGAYLEAGRDQLTSYVADLDVSSATATGAGADLTAALKDAVPTLLNGIAGGLVTLSSLAVFLSFTALSLFFLLKDGPEIRAWAEGHMRVSPQFAHGVGDRVLQSLRGYFVGVTAVAIFNGLLVLVGALLLGVPLAGSIAAVTFIGAYIPYLGAWSAAIFSVLVALGGAGPEEAAAMAVVQLLANGVLQQMIQPIAYGAALGIHPLAVLIVTIAGGALFGAVGLILAAPLTAAVARIAADIAIQRPEETAEPPGGAAEQPA